MNTLTSTEARNTFSDLLKEAETEIVQITQHNKPAAAVMSWDFFESLMETLEILSDPETTASLRRGEQDIESGRTADWETVKKQLTVKG